MEIRYLGFEQRQNSRAYRFEVREKGLPSKHYAVLADMSIFRLHSVGIQEGPTLSGNKLTADLEKGAELEQDQDHQLTAADVQAYADSKSLAEAQRAAARKNPRRRPAPTAPVDTRQTSWRNFGI